MNQETTILFVCEHGSAKSVVAAAYCNRLAIERNLSVNAFSRGTNPDEEIPAGVIRGLDVDGLKPVEMKPRLLSKNDVTNVFKIIAFCELTEDFKELAPFESWGDVPPISENFEKSRDAIVSHINQLLIGIKTEK